MNFKKYSLILAAVLLFCLTACTAEPKFPDYADFSFGGYLESLGELREDIEKALSMTDETWDYLEVDGRPGPRPKLIEPVEVGGAVYTLYFRFTEGPEADSPSYLNRYYYVNTVESGNPETKNAVIQALYDLLVTELGEPEEPGVHMVYSRKVSDTGEPEGPVTETPTDNPLYTTVREGFEQGFRTQPHEENWVLAEHVSVPGTKDYPKDANALLLVTMTVSCYNGNGMELRVELRLLDAAYSRIARFAEAQQAREIERIVGK